MAELEGDDRGFREAERRIASASIYGATTLKLNGLGLRRLPTRITQRVNLNKLFLDGNDFVDFPDEIVQLQYLVELDLRNCNLTELPAEIGNLTSLRVLRLGTNQLETLPPAIGRLNNLEELDLSANRLTDLPAQIGELRKLNKLNLRSNDLTSLPEEVDKLDHLSELDLRGNSDFPVSPEILDRWYDPYAILSYLKDLADDTTARPLNEAKVLIVGQGGVGKTSLAKRLAYDDFDRDEPRTEGINIEPWSVLVDGQEIRLNVWDFGGQEIMHATHQFFLTRRSIYLLVLDARKEEYYSRTEYWLSLCQSFGGDSPIIVIVNKIDESPSFSIDSRGLQAKYANIQDTIYTSCATGRGIDELRSAIETVTGQLDYLSDPVLLSWFAVKEKLEVMQEDYIPYSRYETMCQEEGIEDAASQRTLIRFLHDLGIVLNYRDDARLEDTNILNPEWITDGVYAILNNQEISDNKGVLERQRMRYLLDETQYPLDKHEYILQVMRRFELCFPFDGGDRYLIPDLLPVEMLELDWDDEGALLFEYHYEILPGSVISRFIVRMHPYIYQHTYWRNGVMLNHEGNQALVRADQEEGKVFISVGGYRPRDLLAIIRANFDTIHLTIPRIKARGKVPVPGYPYVTVDYGHLLTLERIGDATFVPEGLDKKVSVRTMLEQIDGEANALERAHRLRLREHLTNYFNQEELRDFCYELGIDYGTLREGGRSAKAQEIVEYMRRRGRLDEIVRLGQRMRPNLEWEG